MEAAEDEDLKLQRASGSYITELKLLLKSCLWKTTSNGRKVHRFIQNRRVDRIISLIELFQEDPQLFDSHLKHLIPPPVDAYLSHLELPSRTHTSIPERSPTSSAIALILNAFCKVRGSKVIVGFFSNEPRHLEGILTQLEACSIDGIDGTNNESSPDSNLWQERYILLLWLSHLMLAPFDLATISSTRSPPNMSSLQALQLPSSLPQLTLRVLSLCIPALSSATKERHASSQLLVRLVLRPDMRSQGLLTTVMRWSLSFFDPTPTPISTARTDTTTDKPELTIHQYLGILSFISNILASGSISELSPYIPSLFTTCRNILESPHLSLIRASAVARKLVIKSMRNIMIHSLPNQPALSSMDVSAALEDIIDHLLQALADGDTPVRFAASKALSAIALKLDPSLAEEVVGAIIGSLAEDVLWNDTTRDLSAVNPLRWHGLTLTLSHLLYKHAPPPFQLAEILNALLLALNFEQRSATGSSIGTNVRDAACFGIWALSRRYSTTDILAIQIIDIKAANGKTHDHSSVLQFLAMELLNAACLDPAGNIRRGASAALQELVGRHPDTVWNGISLVQIVDFHAVGLRDRALCQVAINAANLNSIYWKGLFQNMLGWRGIGAVDASSRNSSATAIGYLSSSRTIDVVHLMIEAIKVQLKGLPKRDVEGRHGNLLALSRIIEQNIVATEVDSNPASSEHNHTNPLRRSLNDISTLKINEILSFLNFQEKDFTSTILRPELTGYAVCSFIYVSARLSNVLAQDPNVIPPALDPPLIHQYLNFCLSRAEPSILTLIPITVREVLISSPDIVQTCLSEWTAILDGSSNSGTKRAGCALALGSAYQVLSTARNQIACNSRTSIINILTSRCTPRNHIEARTIALKSMQLIFPYLLDASNKTDENEEHTLAIQSIAIALQTALNDYTINERGDVGSLVRLEALNATEDCWKINLLEKSPLNVDIRAAVLRLSLEKLDKVRARAAQVLLSSPLGDVPHARVALTDGVSSSSYFNASLRLLHTDTPASLQLAFLEGYISSMGMASESVVQSSRQALLTFLRDIPTTGHVDSQDEGDTYSLTDLANSLRTLLVTHVTNDRVLLPLLETVAFILDMRVLQRLVGTASTTFKWRALLSAVQKAHFKSTQMQKLLLSLDVYRGLSEIDSIRQLVLTKIIGMLIHPFPKVRIAAAETLFAVRGEESLEDVLAEDWSQPPANLRGKVDDLKRRLNGIPA